MKHRIDFEWVQKEAPAKAVVVPLACQVLLVVASRYADVGCSSRQRAKRRWQSLEIQICQGE